MLERIYNTILILLAKRRWLKRIFFFAFPEIGHLRLKSGKKKGNVYLDLRDFQGPSFYIMYDRVPAFYHYEIQGKNKLFESLKKEGTFLDIGANIGLFSLYYKLNREDLPIICFEPQKLAHECLTKSSKSFDFKNFKVERMGVGEKPGDLTLYSGGNNSGGHSVVKRIDNESLTSETIKIVSMDEYAKENHINEISGIKIDVEGFEYHVFKGMKNVLKKHPPILVECQNDQLLGDESLISILEEVGCQYQVECIDNGEAFELKHWREIAEKMMSRGRVASDYLLVKS